MLEFFARYIDQEQMESAFEADDFSAFRLACQDGHTHVLEFFVRHFDQDRLIAAFESDDFYSNVIRFFVDHFDYKFLELLFE